MMIYSKFRHNILSLWLIALILGLTSILTSCLGDEPQTNTEWKDKNDAWILQKGTETDADNNPVFQRIGCDWDPNGYVLMRWHNDRSLTASALSPLSTSTIDVKYEVSTIDSVMVDSSHSRTKPAPGVYRTALNNTITGWQIGISQMHIGDSCTILIPYQQAYGMQAYNGLPPYSDLIFNVKLVGIPGYEKLP